MKKIISTLFFALAILSVVGCTSSPLRKLEAFTTEMKNNSYLYSVEDWKLAFDYYEDVLDSIDEDNLSAEEIHEFGRLNGICMSYLMKGAAVVAGDASIDGLNYLRGLMDLNLL